MGNWNGNGRSGCGCGCNLFTSLANTLNNLFSTGTNGQSNGGCGCNGNNNGCGCNGNNGWNTFANGFVSGVNAANASDAWWENGGNNCPCHGNGGNQNSGTATVNIFGGNSGGSCGCGSNADLSAYTACNNQCFDPYYAQQYALYPFGQCPCTYGL